MDKGAIGEQNDMPPLISDSDNESDLEADFDKSENCMWEDADQDEEEMSMLSGDVRCLFCAATELSVQDVLSHCKAVHRFDLLALCRRWSLNCLDYIRMINYCRTENPSPDQVMEGMLSGGREWQSDTYMKAADMNDLMLQLDVESMLDDLPLCSPKSSTACFPQETSQHRYDAGHQLQDFEAIAALAARVKATERQRDFLKDELDRVLKDMEKLKVSGQQVMMNLTQEEPSVKELGKIKDTSLSDEDSYFASYSHHGIHMTMLKDEVRTTSYRDFMLRNRHLFEGKTVLDVGCGTGILSMFAAKAGAKKVVAVDSSQIIYQAMDIARENNLHDTITFVRGRLEDVTLPVDKFDVIISEWMGYFLLFEAMLDSVVWARDRYLAPGGCVYPDYFTMKIVGVNHPDLTRDTLGYWDDVYGFRMTCMKKSVLDEVHVCTVPGETVVTEPSVIKEIDVKTCKVNELDFESEFTLTCQKDTELTALVGYFDTFFDKNCQHKVEFSTGPQSVRTHWDQAVMILPKPLAVQKDSKLACSITYRKHPQDLRGVIINLTVGQLKLKYSLY